MFDVLNLSLGIISILFVIVLELLVLGTRISTMRMNPLEDSDPARAIQSGLQKDGNSSAEELAPSQVVSSGNFDLKDQLRQAQKELEDLKEKHRREKSQWEAEEVQRLKRENEQHRGESPSRLQELERKNRKLEEEKCLLEVEKNKLRDKQKSMKSNLLKSSMNVAELEKTLSSKNLMELESEDESTEDKLAELWARNQELDEEVEEEFQKILGLQETLRNKSKTIDGLQRLQKNLQETVSKQATTIAELRCQLDDSKNKTLGREA